MSEPRPVKADPDLLDKFAISLLNWCGISHKRNILVFVVNFRLGQNKIHKDYEKPNLVSK